MTANRAYTNTYQGSVAWPLIPQPEVLQTRDSFPVPEYQQNGLHSQWSNVALLLRIPMHTPGNPAAAECVCQNAFTVTGVNRRRRIHDGFS